MIGICNIGFYISFIPVVLMIFGIALQTYSAFLFAKTWLIPDEKIHNVSRTIYGGNPHTKSFLRESRTSTYQGLLYLILGMLFLIISTIMQIFLH